MATSFNHNLPRKRICILTDPRFSGGTSSAVAQEIRALSRVSGLDLEVRMMDTAHFKGKTVNSRLDQALRDAGKGVDDVHSWDHKINAHTIILHNPAALKFDEAPPVNFLCDQLLVICHENFLRPDGREGFDVEKVLRLLRSAGYARHKVLAPISDWNRQTVLDWLAMHPDEARHWNVAEKDWFNICDFEIKPPKRPILDRRGRVSRAGFEKFPSLAELHACFPASAECNRILGGDSLLADPDVIPAHWEVLPFGAEPVEEFLTSIDIFVYFTNLGWRESFGRAIAEAIAAGKLVITDPQTARIFGPGVIACRPDEVSSGIAQLLSDQEQCHALIRRAQKDLLRFGSKEFVAQAVQMLFKVEMSHDLM